MIKRFVVILMLMMLPFSSLMALDFSGKVFEFQKRMANKGNPVAQYKLGGMYEAGMGTERSYDDALTWYKKSAAQKYKPALRRITYIDILKNGYKKKQHEKWLHAVQQDVRQGDGEAMLLLGVMHKKSIGVERNYNKAEKYLKLAAAKNVAGSEDELESVRYLINEEKIHRAKEQKRLAVEKEKQKREAEASKRAAFKARQQQLQKEREKQRMLALLKEEQKKKSQAKKNLIKKKNEAPVAVVKKKKELSWAEAMALKKQREANE